MTAMKVRRGISGEQMEVIGFLVMVWPRVYQRRRRSGARMQERPGARERGVTSQGRRGWGE